MYIYTKKKTGSAVQKPSAHTEALLNCVGQWAGSTVTFEVEKPVSIQGLTALEIAALRKSHGTSTPNFLRALEVKSLISRGLSRSMITAMLRHKGRGYQSRMVHADYAALSKR